MQQSPDHEVPASPVPQPAQQHRQDEVRVGEHLPLRPQSGQRKIKIISQPVGKADVPAPPEIGDILSRVRHIEVRRQLDGEQQRRADRYVGVAGKIVIELQGVGIDGNQCLGAGVQLGQIEDAVDQIVSQVIGDEELLGESQRDEKQRPAAVRRRERLVLLFELGNQSGDASDGSGERRGEERNRRQVGEIAGSRLGVPAVDVDGVGERLKRVEGDAQREYPAPLRRVAAGKARIVLEEERHVFERRQNSQIQQDAERDESPPEPLGVAMLKSQRDQEVARGSGRNEEEIEQVPLGVEKVVGKQDYGQRERAEPSYGPVEKENAYQENEVSGAG